MQHFKIGREQSVLARCTVDHDVGTVEGDLLPVPLHRKIVLVHGGFLSVPFGHPLGPGDENWKDIEPGGIQDVHYLIGTLQRNSGFGRISSGQKGDILLHDEWAVAGGLLFGEQFFNL